MKEYSIVIKSIIISLIVYLLCIHFVNNIETVHYNEIPLENLLDIADSGDILLFRWKFINPEFRIFSKFCHVGIILRDSNQDLFLSEIHPLETDEKTNTTKKGVNVYPLKQRIQELQKMDNRCYFLKSRIVIPNVEKNTWLYSKIPFDDAFRLNFVKNWFFSKIGYKQQTELKSIYCSQFIYLILEDLLNDEYNINNFSPDCIEHLHDKMGNKMFNDIVLIN